MATLFPDIVKVEDFKSRYLEEYGNGYVTRTELHLRFRNHSKKVIKPHRSKKHGFSISSTEDHILIEVPKGMWYDGATFAIDYESRLLFALAHDCGCWASQETGDNVYERMFDELAFEIVRKQGGWWGNAWSVELAVRAWDSTNG